ncbi:MAG: hypothetical protein B7Y47_02965 [Sphingomonas sp. 28-63-12]|nr:MAG: hypothetical protein B7Y47_02965 [Sphingomonas sp. 28-63-12]
MSINDVRKSRGRPAIGSTPITVRIVPEQLAALDRWREAQAPVPTRPEAVRRLIEIALQESAV